MPVSPEILDRQDELIGRTFVRLKFLGRDVHLPGEPRVPVRGSLRDVSVRSLEELVQCVEEWLGTQGTWRLRSVANCALTATDLQRPSSFRTPIIVHVDHTEDVLLRQLEFKLQAEMKEAHRKWQEGMDHSVRETVEGFNKRCTRMEDEFEQLGRIADLQSKPQVWRSTGGFFTRCCPTAPAGCRQFPIFWLCFVALGTTIMTLWRENSQTESNMSAIQASLQNVQQNFSEIENRTEKVENGTKEVRHRLALWNGTVRKILRRGRWGLQRDFHLIREEVERLKAQIVQMNNSDLVTQLRDQKYLNRVDKEVMHRKDIEAHLEQLNASLQQELRPVAHAAFFAQDLAADDADREADLEASLHSVNQSVHAAIAKVARAVHTQAQRLQRVEVALQGLQVSVAKRAELEDAEANITKLGEEVARLQSSLQAQRRASSGISCAVCSSCGGRFPVAVAPWNSPCAGSRCFGANCSSEAATMELSEDPEAAHSEGAGEQGELLQLCCRVGKASRPLEP